MKNAFFSLFIAVIDGNHRHAGLQRQQRRRISEFRKRPVRGEFPLREDEQRLPLFQGVHALIEKLHVKGEAVYLDRAQHTKQEGDQPAAFIEGLSHQTAHIAEVKKQLHQEKIHVIFMVGDQQNRAPGHAPLFLIPDARAEIEPDRPSEQKLVKPAKEGFHA